VNPELLARLLSRMTLPGRPRQIPNLPPPPAAGVAPDQRNAFQAAINHPARTARPPDVRPILQRLAESEAVNAVVGTMVPGPGVLDDRIRQLPKTFGGGIQATLPDGRTLGPFRTRSQARSAIKEELKLPGRPGREVLSDAQRVRFQFTGEAGRHTAETSKGVFDMRRGADGLWRIRAPGTRSPFSALEVNPHHPTYRTFNEAKAAVKEAAAN